ncbi:aldo/keto reductase [Streptococcus constellatus]|uniref:Oxidoreductase, aldo/keto reductase family protein n=1 Tax=Streptococcus constellatus subsp. constellatus SK53 TaxID=1095730 RepID=A0AAD2Y479_STRCV|nr:aldo/keto reductase [Streptococcus constellatus]EID19685.1 oxidoreductase, aldo/keto reductase family protein [Streptococcus constellatus subsp. constellatus SK53]MDP1484886.1 aldo/keto reductase [Streptococcus constellatus]QQT04888.1 aldo/keto reductase [Streptococcus constellatus]SUN41177.1 aldo/keto reductase [Streptococcus constellatus]BBD23242.1 aldo/keto reductase [Streptococcus constellatus subsp. constellatus]
MTTITEAKIALGTWSWGIGGFAGGDAIFGNQLDTKDLQEVFEVAVSNGLNLFDTAYAYANGESERILGELINAYGRDQIVISDKFTPGMQNDSAENPVVDMLAGSLKRLGTDFIDIYWIHNSADVERWTSLMVEAVKTGKIGRIGVSNHSLEQVKRVQEILAPHGIKVSAVQNHFSLLYRRSIEDGLLDYCKENGIQFFSYMVLEQGALSGKYNEANPLPENSNRGKTYNPLFPALKALLASLQEIAEKYAATPAQIATAWAIGRGTTPILGVTKVEQVRDATQAAQITLTPEEVSQLEELAIASGVDTRGGWEGQA